MLVVSELRFWYTVVVPEGSKVMEKGWKKDGKRYVITKEAGKPVCSGAARQTRRDGRRRRASKQSMDGWGPHQRIYRARRKKTPPQQPPAHHRLSACCAYSSRYDSLRISPSRMRACESWFSSCRISTCGAQSLAQPPSRPSSERKCNVPAAPSA